MLTQEQQIFEQVKKANNILITFKKTWTGDTVASALALLLFLKKINKNAEIVAEKFPFDKLYSFLPAFKEIKYTFDNIHKFIISLNTLSAKVDQVKYRQEDDKINFIVTPKEGLFSPQDVTSYSSGPNYDIAITVDTPDLEALGKIYDENTDFFYQVPIINVDHNSNNEEYGQINFIKLTAVATTEILFSLFDSYSRDLINEDIATCLLAGMISETRSFKTPTVTPQALLASSQLISMGARREEIVNQFYRSRSLNILKLWGRVLARLSSGLENKLIWSTLTLLDFSKTDSDEKDLTDVIDELIINIPQAKVIVLLYEKPADSETSKTIEPPLTPKTVTNILIYAIKNLDSLDLIKEYNPSGSKNLAQAVISLPVQEAEKIIIDNIKERLNKLPL